MSASYIFTAGSSRPIRANNRTQRSRSLWSFLFRAYCPLYKGVHVCTCARSRWKVTAGDCAPPETTVWKRDSCAVFHVCVWRERVTRGCERSLAVKPEAMELSAVNPFSAFRRHGCRFLNAEIKKKVEGKRDDETRRNDHKACLRILFFFFLIVTHKIEIAQPIFRNCLMNSRERKIDVALL